MLDAFSAFLDQVGHVVFVLCSSFLYGCAGSLLLCMGFLSWQVGAALHGGAQASHCIGFSLPSRGSRHAGLGSWGARAWLVAPQRVRLFWARG